MGKNGILFGGNIIIDRVKIIDSFPPEGMLANIINEYMGTGGAPYNNSVNIKKLNNLFKTGIMGRVGNDWLGDYILKDLKNIEVDTRGIIKTSDASTSYTDVMTVKSTGIRTFFHNRGANALWDYDDIKFDMYSDYKIVQIGYALLLDKMDLFDADYGTKLARVLSEFQQIGLKTSIDVVSENSERFNKIVVPSLKYVDYLILNEIEAGQIVNEKIRVSPDSVNMNALKKAAEKLAKWGNPELIIIHMPEGGYGLTKTGEKFILPSHNIEQSKIKSTVGAGDAYASGVLYGIHEQMSLENCMKLGTAMAGICLFGNTTTDSAVKLSEVENFMKNVPYKKFA